jgi:CheY-like chemotaxis protein
MSDGFFILLVEDEEADAFIVRRALLKSGIHSVLNVVTNGRDAIDYLSGLKKFSDRTLHPMPNLVILDLRMPVVNGYEVLEWMRQDKTLARLPVVVMSGSHLQETVDRVKQLGAIAYIMKRSDCLSLAALFKTVYNSWEKSQHFRKESAQGIINSGAWSFLDDRTL